jgi:uncharacterized protein YndB with AHSA1/START domain
MFTVSVTRAVDAPVERVWTVFTDLTGRAAWLSTVDAVDVLTAPPFAVGTVWRETRPMSDGPPVTEEFRVEECTPPHGCTVSSPGDGAAYRMTYSLRGRGAGTLVTVRQEGAPTVASGRLLSLVLGGLAARTVEGALRQDLDDLAAAATA